MGDPHHRVILFVFAGRRQNMELQLPLIRRILAQYPQAEYHVWNLARDHGDARYLQTIEGERITVRNEFFGKGLELVYRHYAAPSYRDAIFVKLDDDIVFIQTARFGAFVEAIKANPNMVISANIINNGACTPLEEGLWNRFQRLAIPLLDVHMSAPFAGIAHNWFFENYPQMMAQPAELIPTQQWLSINLIGYNHAMGRRIAAKVGAAVGTRAAPMRVAGRGLTFLGDEGLVNTLPRVIMRGFVAAHLTFGPQKLTDVQLAPWRACYGTIGQHYLAATADASEDAVLPPFTRDIIAEVAARWGANDWRTRSLENDPRVGRFTP